MSNERIDLTKFEGMEEWEVEKRPDGGYAIKTGRDNFSLEEAETIAKLPTLIDELKKCYELIDAQKEELEFCWNVVENIDEARWADAVQRLVVEHHPSKWCDYTYCPLCDEETASE